MNRWSMRGAKRTPAASLRAGVAVVAAASPVEETAFPRR
jgi:hypothetical protein